MEMDVFLTQRRKKTEPAKRHSRISQSGIVCQMYLADTEPYTLTSRIYIIIRKIIFPARRKREAVRAAPDLLNMLFFIVRSRSREIRR